MKTAIPATPDDGNSRFDKGWLDLYESGADGTATWSEEAPPFLQQIKSHIPAGSSVLELCAGDGRITEELVRGGANVTALDLSPAALKRLDENFKRHGFPLWRTEA
jgi:methylase of polypeptide subunit release factors